MSSIQFCIIQDYLLDIIPKTLIARFSVLLMNYQPTNETPHETIFNPDDPWIANKKDIKPYILEHLDNIKCPDPNILSSYS